MYVPSKWSFSMESIMRWWIMETCSVSEQFLWPTWFCINYSQLVKCQRTWKLPSLQRSLKETGSFHFLEQHKPFWLCTVAAGKLCTGFWRSFSWLRCLEKSWKQKSASFIRDCKQETPGFVVRAKWRQQERIHSCLHLSQSHCRGKWDGNFSGHVKPKWDLNNVTNICSTDREVTVSCWTAFRGLGQRLLSGVTFFYVLCEMFCWPVLLCHLNDTPSKDACKNSCSNFQADSKRLNTFGLEREFTGFGFLCEYVAFAGPFEIIFTKWTKSDTTRTCRSNSAALRGYLKFSMNHYGKQIHFIVVLLWQKSLTVLHIHTAADTTWFSPFEHKVESLCLRHKMVQCGPQAIPSYVHHIEAVIRKSSQHYCCQNFNACEWMPCHEMSFRKEVIKFHFDGQINTRLTDTDLLQTMRQRWISKFAQSRTRSRCFCCRFCTCPQPQDNSLRRCNVFHQPWDSFQKCLQHSPESILLGVPQLEVALDHLENLLALLLRQVAQVQLAPHVGVGQVPQGRPVTSGGSGARLPGTRSVVNRDALWRRRRLVDVEKPCNVTVVL